MSKSAVTPLWLEFKSPLAHGSLKQMDSTVSGYGRLVLRSVDRGFLGLDPSSRTYYATSRFDLQPLNDMRIVSTFA
jgi:hypothetical protein